MAGDLAFAACTPSTIKVRATYKRPAALTTPRVHDLPEDVDVAPGTEDGGFAGAPERAMMQGAPAGAIAAPIIPTKRRRQTPWSTRLRRAHLPADLPETNALGCGSSWGNLSIFLDFRNLLSGNSFSDISNIVKIPFNDYLGNSMFVK